MKLSDCFYNDSVNIWHSELPGLAALVTEEDYNKITEQDQEYDT